VRKLSLFAAVSLFPLRALAQTCGLPDLLSAVPPDGATGVPSGAPLHAFYAASALYQDEPILLDLPDGTEQALIGEFDPAEGRLTLVPPEPLAPLSSYVVRWPELRGTTAGGKGLGRQVGFTTGAAPDMAPPTFAGATGLVWDWVRDTDDCTDDIQDRLTFDIALGEASDDGGRAQLTLVLSQTQGPRLASGPRQVLLGGLPPEGEPARVTLAVDGAVGRICFAALLRDLVGQISGGGEREACAQTTQPPFFNGCSVAPAGRRGAGLSVLCLALLLAVLRRRSHAR
jgi:hypothetical protein